MKTWPLLLLTLSLPIYSETDSFESFDDVLEPPLEPMRMTPAFFQIDGRGDWIASSKINYPNFTNQKLGFGEVDGRAGYVFPLCGAMYSVAAGYQKTWITLDNIYLFDRSHFQNVYGTLGARFFDGDWIYQAEFQVHADIDLGAERSVLYFYGGSAIYEFSPCFSTTVGFIGRSGIRQDKFWPILGFDWIISDQFQLHAVYPLNISFQYRPMEDFILALTTRFINSRHRLEEEEILTSGILEYRNAGEEIGLTYNIGNFFSINVHAGYMFRGDLKVENSTGDPVVDFKSDGAFYAGGNFLIRF